MTVEDREFLARAQNIEGPFCNCEWAPLVIPGSDMCHDCEKRALPDPFNNAQDLLDLVEWARNQPWFEGCRFLADTTDIFWELPDESSHGSLQAAGPFNEAFPDACLAALRELKINQGVEDERS